MASKRKLQDIISPELMDDIVKKVSAKSYPRRRTAVAVRDIPWRSYTCLIIFSVRYVESERLGVMPENHPAAFV